MSAASSPTSAGPALRDRLLQRIGLDEPPEADAEGLRLVHRAFVSSVPYENLTVQLGESRPLDRDELCARMTTGGRGGYCFEVNTVLRSLLEDLGFEVEGHRSIVGPRESFAEGEPTNHMALVATTPAGEAFVVEAGRGDGFLDPLPLAGGTVRQGPFPWTIERDGDGWWVVAEHEFTSTPGYRFLDAPVELADFEPHHQRLSCSPDSSFVKTLVIQRPQEHRITTLRARTLTVNGPDVDTREILADPDRLAAVLSDHFGIDPDALGAERMARLWGNVVAQHEAYLQERAEQGDGA